MSLFLLINTFCLISGSNGFSATGSHELFAPVMSIAETKCLTFTFKINVAHSFIQSRLAVYVNSEMVWLAFGSIELTDVDRTGMVTLATGINQMVLSTDEGEYILLETALTSGACGEIGL